MRFSEIDLRYQYLWEEEDIFEIPPDVDSSLLIIDTVIVTPFRILSLSSQAPTRTLFSGIRLPARRDLVLSTTPPFVKTPYVPARRDLVLSSTAPSVSGSRIIIPLARDLALSSAAPAKAFSSFISPPARDLLLSQFAPFDAVSDRKLPLTRDLLLSSVAPSRTIVFTSSQRNPLQGNLALSKFAPSVVTTTAGLVAPVIVNLRTAPTI